MSLQGALHYLDVGYPIHLARASSKAQLLGACDEGQGARVLSETGRVPVAPSRGSRREIRGVVPKIGPLSDKALDRGRAGPQVR